MKQYKYPLKRFNGSALEIFPRQLLDQELKFFDERIAFEHKIVGETGIDGLKIDFNNGLQLQIPKDNWHVRIGDYQSDLIFVDDDLSEITLMSSEKFFVHWEVALWLDGEPIFYHQFDPRGQRIHFLFARPLGDNIELLPYVEQFRRTFDCKVSCTVPPPFREIVQTYYPNVELTNELPDDSYACFYMAAWVNMPIAAPHDPRTLSLEAIGKSILSSPLISIPQKIIYTPTKLRSIKEKYVCIGVQASAPNKCWLNPEGWEQVIEHLKALGYRVLCIDRDRKCSNYGLTIEMPDGAEDLSGDYTLIDRVNQLAYADFFIGLISGLAWLAWLAWAVGIPVVMISGITARWYEFDTPYRINNPLVCHGCYNEFLNLSQTYQCPLFKSTDRAYECSKKISARQVTDAVDRLVGSLK